MNIRRDFLGCFDILATCTDKRTWTASPEKSPKPLAGILIRRAKPMRSTHRKRILRTGGVSPIPSRPMTNSASSCTGSAGRWDYSKAITMTESWPCLLRISRLSNKMSGKYCSISAKRCVSWRFKRYHSWALQTIPFTGFCL